MKCPKCLGSGKDFWVGNTFVNVGFPCDKCNGTGEYNPTHQEYIQNCNTEELAELLTRISDNEWKYPVMPSRVDEWRTWLKEKKE